MPGRPFKRSCTSMCAHNGVMCLKWQASQAEVWTVGASRRSVRCTTRYRSKGISGSVRVPKPLGEQAVSCFPEVSDRNPEPERRSLTASRHGVGPGRFRRSEARFGVAASSEDVVSVSRGAGVRVAVCDCCVRRLGGLCGQREEDASLASWIAVGVWWWVRS